jgi:hypothetical protein
MTTENLDFTDITGNGIANRGLLQKDILLGGIAYTRSGKDSFDDTGQHFEPGVWSNVEAATDPAERAAEPRGSAQDRFPAMAR